jgi:3D (Asp-Asp-Asp) domain-containing protein
MKRLAPTIATLSLLAAGCATAGNAWMAEPLPGVEESFDEPLSESSGPPRAAPPAAPRTVQASSQPQRVRVLGDPDRRKPGDPVDPKKLQGKILGNFRNTYYDFPSERDHTGEAVSLHDPRCNVIRQVPRGFYEAVCVQGSGTLSSGSTVSFAKRDCECAAVCPRTKQKICFDELDARQFPWGRGATGQPITPLLTVAVDTELVPLQTSLYIPEFDGMPRDGQSEGVHDGCFIAQDRGMRVKGKHVDVFTGHESLTRLWNQLVPSNKGVTVVVGNPRCARAGDVSSLARQESAPSPSGKSR